MIVVGPFQLNYSITSCVLSHPCMLCRIKTMKSRASAWKSVPRLPLMSLVLALCLWQLEKGADVVRLLSLWRGEIIIGSHKITLRFWGEKKGGLSRRKAEVYRGRPAHCIEMFLLLGFWVFFSLFFFFFFCFVFYSTLDLQACALWVRDYFSVKRVFCHSIEIIKAST